MRYKENGQTIKSWAEDDRPREKFELKGRNALSNAELLAIIIGSGTTQLSAVEVSRLLLTSCNQQLNQLSRQSIQQMIKTKGIGKAKAITIQAALELGRRLKSENTNDLPAITCSRDAYEILGPLLEDLTHEEFHILLLNRANVVVRRLTISKGGISGTVVDARLIFKPALELLASSVILCHNHPSGKIKPSEADISLTKKLKQAGKMMDVNILDHLIIGHRQYYSFADEGIL